MYSPKIAEHQIRTLYQLKLRTNKSMVQLVREALAQYLEKHSEEMANDDCSKE